MSYDYSAKLITTERALSFVKSGDLIFTGLAASAASGFMNKLHTIADSVKDVKVNASLALEPFEFMVNPKYSGSFMVETWFLTPPIRTAATLGAAEYAPCHLQYCAVKQLVYRQPDIFVGTASMPDEDGYVTLSLSNSHETRMLSQSKLKILEINPNYPRMNGDHRLHIDDIDYLVKTDYLPPELADAPSNDRDKIIGQLIANEIHDGDTIQLGIGGIPNAVSAALFDKRDLGIHTELFTTGMMRLMKAGVITNKRKNFNTGKAITTFIGGTRELYEFVTNNPNIEVREAAYSNNPYIIGQNDNMVSINTTIEVDITGQCCSESIGSRQFSGTGGQTDTAVGAQLSKGGRSFIALYSTAMVKNSKGEREEVSKIVSRLRHGAVVSLMRNDLDYLVTEYGIARVKGMAIGDRVRAIIGIAHPKYRDSLLNDAYEFGIINRRYGFNEESK